MPLELYIIAGVAALVVGTLLGFILTRASARRQADRLNSQVQQLEAKLADATNSLQFQKEPPSTPTRWTGTEIAAVIGAIGSLCGILGTIYNSYQGSELARLKTEITKLESSKAESEARFASLTSSVRSTFRLEPQQWDRIERVSTPTGSIKDVKLDDKYFSNICRGTKTKLIYWGSGPAILECDEGSALIQLKAGTKILFLPKENQRPTS